RVQAGCVRVEDARGQPPSMPFWLGEAPARSVELSAAVSILREEIDAALPQVDAAAIERCIQSMAARHRLSEPAARQLVEYLACAKAMLGALPTQRRLVFERFFDEAGDMHLVVHAPFGSRINRAFGLTLRKRFCRAFNFELQAAATEDAIVLSLGETHSFALEQLPRFLSARTVESLLVQAVLDAPLFTTRWRWNATIALAIRRARGGSRTPAPLQRMAAEDLIAVVFPDKLACAENLSGEREIPEHPLVRQTLWDCLHEAMDVDALAALLTAMERGEIEVLARDLPQPSPLAQEVLNARPYAYLDDAPLEERRTQAVAGRRWLDADSAAEFGQLSQAAIDTVRAQARPAPENADELHDALMLLGLMRPEDGLGLDAASLNTAMDELQQQGRAVRVQIGASAPGADGAFWVAVEQLPMVRAIYPQAAQAVQRGQAGPCAPAPQVPVEYAQRNWDVEEGVCELLRGQLQASGPVCVAALAARLELPPARIDAALAALEREGFVLQGRFTPGADAIEWCERRLLARIHRYTLKSLRAEIEPVASGDFIRFLLEWHGVTRSPQPEGAESLERVLEQLEGCPIPAAAWEADVLPARLKDYDGTWLDSLCLSGRVYWARLEPPQTLSAGPVRATPIALLTRRRRSLWQCLAAPADGAPQPPASASAAAMEQYLQ
ncbi:MAG: Lhr family ATP-dependent helicase, partial [Steroidobacteraceae bacterium]